jgi:type II secretory pathway component GspD/PulD (secretin)
LIAAVALAGVAALGQQAQPKEIAKAEATPQIARQVYAVRGASAKDLANILTMHFENETAFRAVPDTASNTLLLNGPKAALEDAANVLREIDRPARPVYVEILSLELAGKPTGEGAADAKQFDPSQLSGAAREVRSKVRELLQKGVLGSVKTVELTGLAGQSAQTQVTENRPVVIGVTGFAGGGLFGGGGRGGAGGGPGPGDLERAADPAAREPQSAAP